VNEVNTPVSGTDPGQRQLNGPSHRGRSNAGANRSQTTTKLI
jgi:hypothetical protein